MNKKPAFLLHYTQSVSRCPLSPCTSQNRTRPPRRPQYRRRCYASIADDAQSYSWPVISDERKIPTPYQIFNLGRGEPYSKKTFYQLVKLYHPDRSASSDGPHPCGCSKDVMLERYRLIVAANAILSDRNKREAYDRFGLGWSDWREDIAKDGQKGPYKYSEYHSWRTDPSQRYRYDVNDDPMYNATWEDWERWYERQSPARQESPWSTAFFSQNGSQRTIYANNKIFISMVALLAAFAGIGQATQAHTLAHDRLDKAAAVSEENARFLAEARDASRRARDDGETRRARIRRFVQEREGYKPGEFDGRVHHPDDNAVCSSDYTRQKGDIPFWKRSDPNA